MILVLSFVSLAATPGTEVKLSPTEQEILDLVDGQRRVADIVQLTPLDEFMTLGIAATVLMHAARPFVQKFSSARTLLVIGVVSVVAHLGLGLVLIPTYGLTGAAWAYCSANVITSLVWFSCFVAGPARRSPGSAAGTSIDGFSAG